MSHLKLVFVFLLLSTDAAISPVCKNINHTTPNSKFTHLCLQADVCLLTVPIQGSTWCILAVQQCHLPLAFPCHVTEPAAQTKCWHPESVLEIQCNGFTAYKEGELTAPHTSGPSLLLAARGGHGHPQGHTLSSGFWNLCGFNFSWQHIMVRFPLVSSLKPNLYLQGTRVTQILLRITKTWCTNKGFPRLDIRKGLSERVVGYWNQAAHGDGGVTGGIQETCRYGM